MGKTGQIRAGGRKKGRVNEVFVGVDEDDDDDDEDDDEKEEEEEDATLPGLTSPEAASDEGEEKGGRRWRRGQLRLLVQVRDVRQERRQGLGHGVA